MYSSIYSYILKGRTCEDKLCVKANKLYGGGGGGRCRKGNRGVEKGGGGLPVNWFCMVGEV